MFIRADATTSIESTAALHYRAVEKESLQCNTATTLRQTVEPPSWGRRCCPAMVAEPLACPHVPVPLQAASPPPASPRPSARATMEGDYDLAAGDELFEYFEEEEEGQVWHSCSHALSPSLPPTTTHPTSPSLTHSACSSRTTTWRLTSCFRTRRRRARYATAAAAALSLSPTHHHPPHVTIPHSACLGSSADRLHTGCTALTVPR